MEVMDRLRSRGRDGQRLPCSVSRKPVHSGDSVWHANAGLARARGYRGGSGASHHAAPAPGTGTLYAVHLSGTLTATDYALLVAMGLLAGLCGPLLMWLMAFSHGLFLRLKLSPPWQLALGGAIVGLLSLLTPKVWGTATAWCRLFCSPHRCCRSLQASLSVNCWRCWRAADRARRAGCSRPRCLSAWRQGCCLHSFSRCGCPALRR